MKRKGLLLAAVLTLALWLGVGTAFAGGGLPLLGGGGQDNTAIVVQNIASGNTIQGIGNEAGSNGAVAAANVDQTNVDQVNGHAPGTPEDCGCQQPESQQGSEPAPADQQNGAVVVQNVASGNTIQGIGNEAGSNGAVAEANVDQTNADETTGRAPGGPDGCLCDRIDGPQGPDQSRPADQQNDAVVVQNVASGNTVQGAFNNQGRDGTHDGCGCDEHPQEGGQNGAVALANVDQTNVDRQSGDEQRCGSCGGSDSSGDSSADQSNRAVVVQNVASGNTIQLIGNKAGSNRAVAVAGVDQTNAASSQGEDGGSDVEQSNRALVVQNVASGNTIQGAFNRSSSNAAFAVAAVDQKNVSSDGRTSYQRDDVTQGCDSCSPQSHETPHPPAHHPCPPPEHHPCPPAEHHPCPAPEHHPCPAPEHHPCAPPEHHPCPPKPCPGSE